MIFDTERTYAREMTADDYRDLCEILQDEETMYAYEHAFSDDEVGIWLNRQLERYKQDGIGLWAVIDKQTGQFVGQMGLTYQDVEGTRELEIGYLLKKKYWHQGYATEVALACKEYAFDVLRARRVVSIIRDTNYASQRVAERIGMKPEHHFIKHYYEMDMPHVVYAIEKDHAVS